MFGSDEIFTGGFGAIAGAGIEFCVGTCASEACGAPVCAVSVEIALGLLAGVAEAYAGNLWSAGAADETAGAFTGVIEGCNALGIGATGLGIGGFGGDCRSMGIEAGDAGVGTGGFAA